ncbi:MAG: DUF4388 domain-containing protein, partial [Nitrospinota bacterium]
MTEKGDSEPFFNEVGGGGAVPSEPMLEETTGLSGNITDINLLEIVQFFSLTQKTKALEIFFDGKVGQFFIENGQIIHAETDGITGEEAVFLCLSSRDCTFREVVWAAPEVKSVTSPTSALLLDIVSRLDEEKESGKNSESGQCDGKEESAWRENCLSEIGRLAGVESALLVTRMKDEKNKISTAVNSIGPQTNRLKGLVRFYSGLSGKIATATGFEKVQNILIRSTEGFHTVV